MQCNAMQCNAMQCNAMQCNAMQCNAMQCNAILFNSQSQMDNSYRINSHQHNPTKLGSLHNNVDNNSHNHRYCIVFTRFPHPSQSLRTSRWAAWRRLRGKYSCDIGSFVILATKYNSCSGWEGSCVMPVLLVTYDSDRLSTVGSVVPVYDGRHRLSAATYDFKMRSELLGTPPQWDQTRTDLAKLWTPRRLVRCLF